MGLCCGAVRSSDDVPPAGTVESRNHFLAEARKLGSVFFVCVGIWLLGGAGYFWPMWVLLFIGFRLGPLARHAYSSSAGEQDDVDVDADVDAPVRR